MDHPVILTYSTLKLDIDDGALVSLVDPGVVPELGDPALGRPVGGPGVHETVYNDQADDGVGVPVHYLGDIIFLFGNNISF